MAEFKLLDPARRRRWSLWRLWAFSFAVWMALACYYALAMCAWQKVMGQATSFRQALFLPAMNFASAAFASPLAYLFAVRFPIERQNWRSRVALHFLGCIVFVAFHAAVRMAIYPLKDSATGAVAKPSLILFWSLLISFLYDDGLTTYWPIVGIAHLITYRRELRDRELRASQLETMLAQAQLQALKMQLNPHFLFNTLHSVSALMRRNLAAADRMIARLSDLLRLSLENVGVQETSVSQELDFLRGYLEIEQARFSDRLLVRIDVDPAVLDATVPYMLMQPLVENAVRHAISEHLPVHWRTCLRCASPLSGKIGDRVSLCISWDVLYSSLSTNSQMAGRFLSLCGVRMARSTSRCVTTDQVFLEPGRTIPRTGE